jgi:hypothetical protein
MSPPEGPNSPYNRDPYLISSLEIDGRPLRASPDMVFQEVLPAGGDTDKHARIIIVEIKCTNAEVPPRLWPNVRAQLWAYSKIDEFSDASEIILVGEVWRVRPDLAMLDRTKVWRTPCADLDEEGNRLFHAYKTHLTL